MGIKYEDEDPVAEVMEETFGMSKVQQGQVAFNRYKIVIAEMRLKAAAHIVADDETNIVAVEYAGQAKAITKAIEKKRKELVGPLNEVVSQINQFTKPLVAELAEIDQGLNRKITIYKLAQERERLERQRKANEAAQKIQAEINKEAEKLGETPAIVVQPVVLEVATVTRTDSGSASLRTTWTFEVEDFALLPNKYKLADRAAINSEVKAGIRQIPGVRIFEETKTCIRSASIPAIDQFDKF